ncbi:hypothetical protein UP00_10180 [Enterobacter asburiae]|nr:hypothetical protein UP00_10180 [Enterobacter asburiae]MXV01464.1 hypothetical protein [Enterobacter sp. ABFQC]SAB09586.1 Uncharacterised protein [Enterobacter ludwigii]
MTMNITSTVTLKLEHVTRWDGMHRHIFTVIRTHLGVVMLCLVGWSVVQSKVALLEWQEELLVEQLPASVSPVVEMVTGEEIQPVPVIVQEVTSAVLVADK